MTPQTINAYYSPTSTRSSSRPPSCSRRSSIPTADPAVNYGGIGGGDRPRDDPRLRRPGPQVRRRRQRSPTGGPPTTPPSSTAQTEKLGAQYSAFEPLPGVAHQRRPDHGREHRRPGRPAAGARRLSRVAERQAGAGDRRPDRRPARVPRLGPGLARQVRATTPCASSWSPTRTRRAHARVNGPVRNIDAWYDGLRRQAGRQALHRRPSKRVRIWWRGPSIPV